MLDKVIIDKIEKPVIVKQDYIYIITDPEIVDILDKLPINYFNNYGDWLIVTTVLKKT